MKKNSKAEILQTGRLIKEICQYYNALFIVNDQVEIARQLDADGVHLGLEDMNPEEARKILGPDKIIGATCNTMEDIRLRAIQKVDYIGLGPFRYTTTKQKLSPVGGRGLPENPAYYVPGRNFHTCICDRRYSRCDFIPLRKREYKE